MSIPLRIQRQADMPFLGRLICHPYGSSPLTDRRLRIVVELREAVVISCGGDHALLAIWAYRTTRLSQNE